MTDDINDTLRTEGPEGVRARHDRAYNFNGNGSDQSAYHNRPPTILSKHDFLKGFEPPDYLVDGILQRRFIYAHWANRPRKDRARALDRRARELHKPNPPRYSRGCKGGASSIWSAKIRMTFECG